MTSRHKRYKAFVSSTFIDLKDHRAHVIRSLRRAGFDVDPMEDWTADSDEPKKFSQDRLAGCDVCILLVGFRRGFVPEGEALSITQMEYEAALEQGVEVLVYQLDDNAKWWAKYDAREKDQALGLWRNRLGKEHGVEFFTDDPQSVDVTSALTRWMAKSKVVQSESEKIERIDWPDGKSPYRGLQWFTPEYAPLFFGRDREVDDLITKMSHPGGRALLVIGASGSGKSSVVAAGVWKAIIQEGRLPGRAQWIWQRIQPSDGDSPSDALARGLKEAFQLSARPRLTATDSTLRDLLAQHLSQGQELILFIDQFEELFTSGFKDPDIQSFLELLISTAQDLTNRLRVVATIRSEFLGKLEAHEPTLKLLNSPYRYHLSPVSPRMLQDMVEKPAEATGYTFEPGLVEWILQDTGQEPGNLALVEYALKQLFERRAGRTFTMEAYEAIGGVVGAIATKANEVLSILDEAVRGSFDRVFAELVHLDRERLPTRRRATLSTFSSDQSAVQLIDALASHECRVLVTSRTGPEAIVEVAHEKLFTAWPKLQLWIDESGEALREIDHAEEEAQRWQKSGDNPQELWRGSRAKKVLEAIEQFGKHPSPVLSRFLRPQHLLLGQLRDPTLSHELRALIGRTLDEFGDPRAGIGLGPDGLPDIVWIDIPGGEVELQGVNHLFHVKPFRIAKYPVTNLQFEAFLKTEDGYRKKRWWRDIIKNDKGSPPEWSGGNRPRTSVSWYEAVAFCRWLSAKTGTSVRLPTEWEWQQAVGWADPERVYPREGKVEDDSRRNHWDSRLMESPAVGLYPAGATQEGKGIYDLAGTVWEWCLNEFDQPERPEAVRIHIGDQRGTRGSSFNDSIDSGRVWVRYKSEASRWDPTRGFRLVQDIP